MVKFCNIYIDEKETLYGIPTGLSTDERLGTTDMNKLVLLQYPYSDEDLVKFLYETINLCETERGLGLKDPGPLEVHFKKKSWTAATKKLRLLHFWHDEKNKYFFVSSQKQPKGAYSMSKEKYMAGSSPTDEELINAFIDAKNNSTL